MNLVLKFLKEFGKEKKGGGQEGKKSVKKSREGDIIP